MRKESTVKAGQIARSPTSNRQYSLRESVYAVDQRTVATAETLVTEDPEGSEPWWVP